MNEDLVARHGVGLLLRTGVNTGEVVAGDPSTGSSFVAGDAVNVAARLEQAATPGEILLGEDTFRLVADLVEAELLPPLTLKGKSEPVPAYRLVRIRETEAPRRLVSPLVGRDADRERLLSVFESAVQTARPAVAVILGPPGIGKSRLVEDVCFAVESDASALIIRLAGEQQGDGAPLASVITNILDAADREADGTLAARVARQLSGREQAEVIAGTLARIVEGAPVDSREAAWALGELLAVTASAHPLLIVLEDAHDAELEMLETLNQTVIGLSAPIALFVTARPEIRDEHPGWLESIGPTALVLYLSPLVHEALDQIVQYLLGGPVDASARARVVEASGGNPLFLEEMLRGLLEDGTILHGPNGWEAHAADGARAMPTSIRAVLAARLDQLPDDERAGLEAAAVLDRAFAPEELSALLEDGLPDGVEPTLARLVHRELLVDLQGEEQTFGFPHGLLREAAYKGMTKESRAELHERAADMAESAGHPPDRSARHLDQAFELRSSLGTADERAAGLARRAAETYAEAANNRLERGDRTAARTSAARARELLAQSGAENMDELRRSLASLAFSLAEWDVVVELLDPTVNRDTDPAARKELGVALTKRGRDDADLDRGRALLEEAATIGRDSDALASLAGTWKGIDQDRARELYRRAHELDPADPYALGNHLEYEIEANGDLSVVERLRSGIEEAAARCRAQAEEGENLPWAWFDLGKFRLLLREAEGALAAYAAAVDRSTAAFHLSTSRRSLERLARFGEISGLEEARRLLVLGIASNFADEADPADVRAIATPGAWPLAPPVIVLVGGSSAGAEERLRAYRGPVLTALEGRSGTVVSGGTRQGISALAGEVDGDWRVVGYLPAAVPDDVSVDDDPRRYTELRRSDGHGFGPREPLRYWADALTSGLHAEAVHVLAIGGGPISAFECRLALALGTRVGAIKGSGGSATDLLRDPIWSASGRVEEVDATAAAIGRFLSEG
jgi:tetratricopeptide (TPR) repeat protein